MPSHQPHATTSTLASLSPLNLPSSKTTSRDTSYLSSLGTTPCAYDDCRLLDLLPPLLCTDCGGKYCGEHSTPQQHRCDRRLARREDGEDIVKEAFSGPRNDETTASSPQCSHRRCHKSLATLRLECARCGLGFCAAHRDVAKHDCQGAARTSTSATASATAAMKRLALQDTPRSPEAKSDATSTAPSSSTLSSSKLPALPSLGDVLSNRKVDKRVAAERLSQLRALQSRRDRGLKLSQADEYRLAELMAEHKDHHKWTRLGKSGDDGSSKREDCIIM